MIKVVEDNDFRLKVNLIGNVLATIVSDMKLSLVDFLGRRITLNHIVKDDNTLIADIAGSTLSVGEYGVELTGVQTGSHFCSRELGLIGIVYTNSEANLNPTEVLEVQTIEVGLSVDITRLQSDWAETDTESPAYIKNKPSVYTQSQTAGLVKNDGSIDTTTYEPTANKKNTITGNESSNTYYPTTKAVADYVNGRTMVVNIREVQGQSEVYEADKTFAEISAHIEAGGSVVAKLEGIEFSLTGYEQGFVLFSATGAIYGFASISVTIEPPAQGETDDVVSMYSQGNEDVDNKVTSISAQSTDQQYPSAKCVYDLVGDVETLLAAI